MTMTFAEIQALCHKNARDTGWWDGEGADLSPRGCAIRIALIHSEVSEALEGFRKNLPDNHLPQYPMAAVELADTVIRILDLAEAKGYSLSQIIFEKLAYNRQRDDHKRESRAVDGGKKF